MLKLQTSSQCALPSNTTAINSYDPQKADLAVQHFLLEKRSYQLLSVFARFLALSMTDKVATVDEAARARRVRQLLAELGPSFVKLGQFMSCRKDILPEKLAAELSLLEDSLSPMSYEEVKSVIESELGTSPEFLFKTFTKEPFAAASIGQVHHAVLKNGTEVAVKVQRQNLSSVFYRDLGYMRLLSNFLAKLGQLNKSRFWTNVSDEFGKHVFAEMNYLEEGRNADRLRKDFRLDTEIIIPRIYWKYTSKRVLTLDYTPGIKISAVDELTQAGIDTNKLANLLVKFYAGQILKTGFFHADPHAGNLAANSNGELIVYDFGMTSEIKQSDKNAIETCITALAQKDSANLYRGLHNLGIARQKEMTPELKQIFDSLLSYFSGGDLTDIDWQAIEKQLDDLIEGQSFYLPPNLTYLIKTVSSLEGIIRNLKPNFNFRRALQPSLQTWLFNLLTQGRIPTSETASLCK
ncbi:MAG: hypothetical protein K2Y22_12320 [Candidatus Obscuribacterales bacterium]|nr:hypothetical protein [Candidatus Obscuribacterales bacterium]